MEVKALALRLRNDRRTSTALAKILSTAGEQRPIHELVLEASQYYESTDIELAAGELHIPGSSRGVLLIQELVLYGMLSSQPRRDMHKEEDAFGHMYVASDLVVSLLVRLAAGWMRHLEVGKMDWNEG